MVMKRPMVAFLTQLLLAIGRSSHSRAVGGSPGGLQDASADPARMSRENPLWGAPRIHGIVDVRNRRR